MNTSIGVLPAPAHAAAGAVDAARAGRDGGQRIGDAHRQVVVAVEADLGFRLELLAQQRDARGDVVRQHVSGGVGDVEAVGAVAFHEFGLLEDFFRLDHVRHHQEADGVQPHLAAEHDVLLGDIGLGAVRGDADGGDAAVGGHLKVIDGADARQQQRRDLGLFHQRHHRAQVLFVGGGREAVVDRGAAEAVAVRDFDQRAARFVETLGDGLHLLDGDLVTLGVHAVAQRHVVHFDLDALEIHFMLLHFFSSLPLATAGSPRGAGEGLNLRRNRL
jgi:hypothetical protein